MFRVAAVLVLGCLGLVSAQVVNAFENINIERSIDVSSQLVRITAKITAENKGTTTASNYFIAIDAEEAKHLSYISATVSGVGQGGLSRFPERSENT